MSKRIKEFDKLEEWLSDSEERTEEDSKKLARRNELLIEMSEEGIKQIYDRPYPVQYKLYISKIRKKAGKKR